MIKLIPQYFLFISSNTQCSFFIYSHTLSYACSHTDALCCDCPSACLWKVCVIAVEGCLEGLGWRKSFKMNRKLGWGTLNCMITVWSVDTIVYQPYHLISCVLVANTQFSGYVFSPKIRVFVKRKKKFHFISWRRHTFLIFLFCSVLKAASGSPTHQISDLPETIQRERYTSVCFFLSIFGHFSKSHHILWQKNEMKDVFPAVKCQNCSNLTWTVCEG